MAERFARGGRLIAVGASPGARSDARHVAVEFVHPVIVGKRALPGDRAHRPGRRGRRWATCARARRTSSMAVGTDAPDPARGRRSRAPRARAA